MTTASGDTAVRELDTSPGRLTWSSSLDALGISQAVLIGEVVAGSAADQAGLRAQDQVVALNGEPVAGWQSWQETIAETLEITVLRDGALRRFAVTPETVTEGEQTFGRIGVAMGGIYQQQFGPAGAILAASERFSEQCEVVWASLVKLVTGKLSLDNLGGPITIAQVAGESASYGIASFLACWLLWWHSRHYQSVTGTHAGWLDFLWNH